MSCKKYRKIMSLYYDGEVSPADREKLMKHLSCCHSCHSYFENLKILQDGIASFKTAKASDEYNREMASRVVRRLAFEQIQSRPARKEKFLWAMKRRWLVALPSFLIIILALFLLYQVAKKPSYLNETRYYYQEPFELIEFKMAVDDEVFLALNDLIEQEIIDLILSEIDYHSFVDYFYFSLESLQDEEK